MRTSFAVVSLLLAGATIGCASSTVSDAPAPSSPSMTANAPALPKCGETLGSRAQLVTPTGRSNGGPRIDEPEACSAPDLNGHYIRIHGSGARKLDHRMSASKAAARCDSPTADARECPTVSIHAFSNAVHEALTARFGVFVVFAVGLGACGEIGERDTLARWNISSRLLDWKHADEAIRIIDGELRRWNIGDAYGLSIMPMACVEPG